MKNIIRGLYFFYIHYFRPRRKKFGLYGDCVTITPPYVFINPANIYIGPKTGIGPYCHLSALNAKCIIKGNCAIAEHFTIHTGNHAREIGKFVTDITEKISRRVMIKTLLLERMYGSDVMLLYCVG